MKIVSDKWIQKKIMADMWYASRNYPWKKWISERWFLECRRLNWGVPGSRIRMQIDALICKGQLDRRWQGTPADRFVVIELT